MKILCRLIGTRGYKNFFNKELVYIKSEQGNEKKKMIVVYNHLKDHRI